MGVDRKAINYFWESQNTLNETKLLVHYDLGKPLILASYASVYRFDAILFH